jgi:predicted O-methyltransferase YrrM
MYQRLKNYVDDAHARQRAAIALARGSASRAARSIDLTQPDTWEFGGFSQNGEDGIIEVLRGQMHSANRSFLEIGSADGVQNNTAWLALVERFEGVMVEGDPRLAGILARTLAESCVGCQFLRRFVTRDNVAELVALLPASDPDLLSLDIDGNDYHIARALLRHGLRPRIVAVEYNAVFGPERAVTVPYVEDFTLAQHPSRLYYGASVAAWRSLFEEQGYRFVTVERNGVNAFFVDPRHFTPTFLDGLRARRFAENKYQSIQHGMPAERQFGLIGHLPLEAVQVP